MSKQQRRRRVLGQAVDSAIRSMCSAILPRKVVSSRSRPTVLEALESRQMLSALYWDTSAAAGLQAGSGSWTTGLFWKTASDGSGAAVGWTDGSDAIFVGNGASTITIPVGVNVTANSITFTGTGYTVTGGTLTLATSTVTAGANATISSVIAGSAGLYKAGNGTLTLGGANTVAGYARVTGGTLVLGNADALRQTTLLWKIVDNGTLSFGSLTAVNVGGLAGAKNLALTNASGAAVAFRVGYNDADTGYSGQLSGSGNFVKRGAGTLSLSYANSAYAGTTWLNGGTLNFVSGGLGSGPICTALDSTLQWAVGNTEDLSLRLQGTPLGVTTTLDTGSSNVAFASGLSGEGVIIKTGSSALSLNAGSSLFTGTLRIAQGTLRLGVGGALTTNTLDVAAAGVLSFGTQTLPKIGALQGSGNVALTNDSSAGVTLVLGNSGLNSDYSGVLSGSGGVRINGGTITLTGANTYSGETAVYGGALVVGNGAATGTLGTGPVTNNTSMTFNRSDAAPPVANVMDGTGDLTQAGGGTLTLTGNNTYTGTTTIASGTLQVGNGGTVGTLGTGAVADNGSLVFKRSDAITVGGVISGAGSLTQAGTGTLTLTGNNTYTGTTTISAGTLQVGGSGTSGTLGSGMVVDNGLLVFSRSDAAPAVANVITGIGGIAKQGSGTLTLTGTANNYTGGTRVGGGTLKITRSDWTAAIPGNAAIPGGDIVVADDATLTLDFVNLGIANVIALQGGVLAFTPQTAAVGGALSGPITVTGASTLDTSSGTIRIDGIVTGIGTLTKTGIGTLKFSPSASNSASLNKSQGQLSVNATMVGQMIESVYNNIELEIYQGSMKGPQAVQDTKGGNDWDQAALLVDMLTKAGVQAQFMYGAVQATVGDVENWLGARTADAAGQILSKLESGILTLTGEGGSPTLGYAFNHAWVRVWVPQDGGGTVAVDVDPSWKTKNYRAGIIGGVIDAVPFNIEDTANLALLTAASASSAISTNPARLAVDGDSNTSWISGAGVSQVFAVDLGGVYNLSRVMIEWGNTYATNYTITACADDVLTQQSDWKLVATVVGGAGGIADLKGFHGLGRFVRLNCNASSGSNYTVKEFEVYGDADLAWGRTASSGWVDDPAIAAVDGNTATSWKSLGNGDQWLQLKFDAAVSISQVTITWDTTFPSSYQVEGANSNPGLASSWTIMKTDNRGTGGVHDLTGLTGSYRFIRIHCLSGNSSSYGISELVVKGGSPFQVTGATSSNQPYQTGFEPNYALDDNSTTAWRSSTTGLTEYLKVDLGSITSIHRVRINWGSAQYPSLYEIQLSSDNATWETVATQVGDGNVDELTGMSESAQYVRVVALTPVSGATRYWIKDLEVYNTAQPYYLPLDRYQQKVAAYLQAYCPDKSIADVSYDGPINARLFDAAFLNSGKTMPAEYSVLSDGNLVGYVTSVPATGISASTAANGYDAAKAADTDAVTEWHSTTTGNQWLRVDYGSAQSVGAVEIDWGATNTYASSYDIQVSNDATNWTTIYSATNKQGGTDVVSGLHAWGRYVQVLCKSGSGTYYAVKGFKVSALQIANPLTAVRTDQTHRVHVAVAAIGKFIPMSAINASSAASGYAAANGADGSGSTEWRSTATGDQSLQVDYGSSRLVAIVEIDWGNSYAASYDIQVSNDTSNWTTVYSATGKPGGSEIVSGLNAAGRYVRLFCKGGSGSYYAVKEMRLREVFAQTALSMPADGLRTFELAYNVSGTSYAPKLLMDLEEVAIGTRSIPSTTETQVELFADVYGAGNAGLYSNGGKSFVLPTGQPVALGFGAGQISDKWLQQRQGQLNSLAIDVSNTTGTAQTAKRYDYQNLLLGYAIDKYWHETEEQQKTLAGLADMVSVQQSVEFGLMKGQATLPATDRWDLQYPVFAPSLAADTVGQFAVFNRSGSTQPTSSTYQAVLKLSGAGVSAWEHQVIEEITNAESLSTIRGFEVALKRGISLISIAGKTPHVADQLNLSTTQAAAIQADVDLGYDVIVTHDPVCVGSSSYAVWRKYLATTGSGYMVMKDGDSQAYGGAGGGETINAAITYTPPVVNPAYSDESISLFNGNMTHSVQDISIPNTGMPIQFSRYYNSLVTGDIGLGVGWSYTYSDRLTITDTQVTWTTGEGFQHQFAKSGTGYISPKELYGSLRSDASGYTYTEKDGTAWRFSATGKLTELRGRNGNTLIVAYTGSQLTSVYDSQATTRRLTFTYGTNGKLSCVTDFTGRIWSYSYLAAGGKYYLQAGQGPGDGQSTAMNMSYAYISGGKLDGLMQKITDNRNDSATLFDYYPNRKIFSVTDPAGNQEHYSYDFLHLKTDYWNNSGEVNENYFNLNGQQTVEVNPDLTAVRSAWNGYQLACRTDELGRTEQYVYDAKGNVIRQVGKDGLLTTYEYDQTFNGVTKTSHPLGRVTWDSAGKATTQGTDSIWVDDAVPAGASIGSDHGDAWNWVGGPVQSGQKAVQSSPNAGEYQHYFTGATTKISVQTGDRLFAYVYLDPRSMPTELMLQWHESGSWDHRAYWGNNSIAWGTDGTASRRYMGVLPAGGGWVRLEALASAVGLEGKSVDGMAFTMFGGGTHVDYEYDALGNLNRIVDTLGNVTTMTYDPRGRLQTQTSPKGNVTGAIAADYTTTYSSFDASGQPTCVQAGTSALTGWSKMEYGYDSRGNVLTSTDLNRAETSHVYDVYGRELKTIFPAPQTGDASPIITYGYDAGAQNRVTDVLGNTTLTANDALSRPIVVTNPDGTRQISVYDAMGNVTASYDELGRQTKYVYDSRNRLVQTIYADGSCTRTTYDGAGRAVANYDALGYCWRTIYDAGDRTIASVDPLLNEQWFSYDFLGDLAVRQQLYSVTGATSGQLAFLTGSATSYTRDLAGRVTQLRGPANLVTTTDYDANGNIINKTQYDVTGLSTIPANPRTLADALKRSVVTIYDALNRPTQVINPDLTHTHATYDLVGRVEETTDEGGNVTHRDYDFLGRLTKDTLPVPDGTGSLPAPVVTYQYDVAGNLTATTDAMGQTTDYVYDNRGRRVYEILPSADGVSARLTTHYDYDAVGDILAEVHGQTPVLLNNPGLESGSVAPWDACRTNFNAEQDPANAHGGSWVLRAWNGGTVYQTIAVSPNTTYQFSAFAKVASGSAGAVLFVYCDGVWKTATIASSSYSQGIVTFTTGPTTTSVTVYAGMTAGTTGTVWFDDLNVKPLRSEGVVFTASDRKTQYTYDTLGRKLTQTDADPDGDGPTELLAAPVTEFAYDAAGRLIQTTYSNGLQSLTTYDALGRPAARWVSRSASGISMTVDGTTATVTVTLASPGFTAGTRVFITGTDRFECNGWFTVASVTADAFTYTAQVSSTSTTIGGSVCVVTQIQSNKYDYGTLTETTDALGNKTQYFYDTAGRKTKQIDPDPDGDPGTQTSSVTQWTYDALGQLRATIDPLSHTTQYEYDKMGKLTRQTAPDPDPSGSGVGKDSPATEYQYDAAGKMTMVTQGTYAGTTFTPSARVTEYFYDNLGRQVRQDTAWSAWDFTEVSGSTVKGRGSNPLDATLTNATVVNGGAGHETAVSMTAASQLAVPLNWKPSSFAVSFWLKPSSVANFNQDISGATPVYAWNGFCFHTTTNGEVYVGTDVTTRLTPSDLPAGTVQVGVWQQFEFRFDISADGQSGIGYFYKNGVLLATRSGMSLSQTWTGFSITNAPGLLDDVRISVGEQRYYDADGNVWQTRDSAGRTVKYVYDNLGRKTFEITPVVDGKQLATKFEYDADGQLKRTTQGLWNGSGLASNGYTDQTTQYLYDNLGRKTLEIAPLDAQSKHPATKYEYDSRGNVLFATAGVWTSGTDLDSTAPQRKTEYRYDNLGRRIFEIAPIVGGKQLATKFEYNADGNLSSGTNGTWVSGGFVTSARVTQYQYDNLGRKTLKIAPLDAQSKHPATKYEYDSRGNVLFATAGVWTSGTDLDSTNQRKTEYRYDNLGRRIFEIAPVVGGKQLATKYEYDADGNLSSVTSGTWVSGGFVTSARATQFQYDNLGRKTLEIAAPDISGVQSAVQYLYDSLGQVATVTQGTYSGSTFTASARLTQYKYDDMGRKKYAITADPDSPSGSLNSLATSYEYDDAGNLTKVASGTYSGTTFTPTTLRETTYKYDNLGRKIQEVQPDPDTLTGGGHDALATVYTYDVFGEVVTSQLGSVATPGGPVSLLAGRTTFYDYDNLGRKIAERRGTASISSAIVAADLRTVKVTTLASHGYQIGQHVVLTGYTGTNTWMNGDVEIVAVTDTGTDTSFTFRSVSNQAAGAVASTNCAAHASYTSYQYDGAGNLYRVVDAIGIAKGDADGTHTTEYQYDNLGRKTVEIQPDPDGVGGNSAPAVVYQYDSAGNLTATIEAYRTTFSPGASGVVTPRSERTTDYIYDNLGRKIAEIKPDPDGIAAGNPRPAAIYTYDDAGNLISEQAASSTMSGGAAPTPIASIGALAHAYDNLGRQILSSTRFKAASASCSNDVATLTLDASINLGLVVGSQVRILVSGIDTIYNKSTSVLATVTGTRSLTYTVTPGGSTYATLPAGATLDIVTATVTYNTFGEVQSSANGAGETTTHTFDNLGRDILTTTPDGISARSDFDADGRLIAARIASVGVSTLACVYNSGPNTTTVTVTTSSGHRFQVGDVVIITGVSSAVFNGSYSVKVATTNTFTYELIGNQSGPGSLASATAQIGLTEFAYDNLDRQTFVRDAFAINSNSSRPTTAYAYNFDGTLLSLTDASNNITSYTYDSLGQKLTETNALSKTNRVYYDVIGRTVRLVDRNNKAITYLYDNLNRVKTETWYPTSDANGNPTGTVSRTISYLYDGKGRLDTTTDTDFTVTPNVVITTKNLYDELDRATSVQTTVTGFTSRTINYSYDPTARLGSSETIRNGTTDNTIAYGYDSFGRMNTEKQSGASVGSKMAAYAYDSAGRTSTIKRYSDLVGATLVLTTANGYTNGQRASIAHTYGVGSTTTYSYTFDAAGRIKTFIESGNGVGNKVSQTYTHDANSQLIGLDNATTPDESFTYDLSGNRTGGGNATGTDNRQTSDGVYNYTYDDEGNRLTATKIATSEFTQYTWDNRNRLTDITYKTSAGGSVSKRVHYAYDSSDQRITKQVDANGDNTYDSAEQYVYDGDQVVLILSASGTVISRFMQGVEVDQTIAQEQGGNVQWYLSDHENTVRRVINNTGVLRDNITYGAFGNIISQTDAAGNPLPANSNDIPRFSYTGREWDADANLFYYRARWFDPAAGRFINQDPIGFAAGDGNLYRYCGNNPLNAIDPTGTTTDYNPGGGREFRGYSPSENYDNKYGTSSGNGGGGNAKPAPTPVYASVNAVKTQVNSQYDTRVNMAISGGGGTTYYGGSSGTGGGAVTSTRVWGSDPIQVALGDSMLVNSIYTGQSPTRRYVYGTAATAPKPDFSIYGPIQGLPPAGSGISQEEQDFQNSSGVFGPPAPIKQPAGPFFNLMGTSGLSSGTLDSSNWTSLSFSADHHASSAQDRQYEEQHAASLKEYQRTLKGYLYDYDNPDFQESVYRNSMSAAAMLGSLPGAIKDGIASTAKFVALDAPHALGAYSDSYYKQNSDVYQYGYSQAVQGRTAVVDDFTQWGAGLAAVNDPDRMHQSWLGLSQFTLLLAAQQAGSRPTYIGSTPRGFEGPSILYAPVAAENIALDFTKATISPLSVQRAFPRAPFAGDLHRRLIKSLPEYYGKTTGVLFEDNGHVSYFRSGNGAPAFGNYPAAAHVEGQAAINIGARGGTGGIMFHNHPSGTCRMCFTNTPTLLPAKASLDIVPVNVSAPKPYWYRYPLTRTGNAQQPVLPGGTGSGD